MGFLNLFGARARLLLVKFLFSLVIGLIWLGSCRCNVFVWWSIFLLITVIFVILSKSVVRFGVILNYFMIQERLGLLFLVLGSGVLRFFVILLKIGVAPLHF